MKKLVFSALLMVTLFSAAFAADESKKEKQVNMRTLHNFRTEFGNLSNVEWSMREDFSKATFTLNNESIQAFFDLNGELIGTSRAVTIDQLPVNVKRVFAKKYADYTVNETIRFEGKDETSYYLSAENGAKSVILKVSVSGGVSLFRAAKK